MRHKAKKCFDKLISVCNNRGFPEIGEEILKLAPKYLNKEENGNYGIKQKNVKYANKITFLASSKFEGKCKKCASLVEQGSASFLRGKQLYHILCGLEDLGEDAESNIYYKRWANKITVISREEETE